MKKRITLLLLCIIMILGIAGCGNKEALKDRVTDYEFSGTADGTVYWSVYFDEDCQIEKYPYEDFIEIIEKCMSRSKNYSEVYVCVNAYDQDGVARFAWDQHDGYVIRETDGNVPNLRNYEWKLTADQYNEIRNARK